MKVKRIISLLTVFLFVFSGCSFFSPEENAGTNQDGSNTGGGKNPVPKPNPSPEPDPSDDFINSENKRGLCYNSLNEAEVKVLADSNVKWVYNWGTHPSSKEDELFKEYGILYIPMQWGRTTAQSIAELRTYYESHPECKYILGFNEPNLGAGVGGSGITPAQAASDWVNIEKIAEDFDLEIIGPALQYSGEQLSDGKVYSTPESWMNAFITEYKKLYGRDPEYDYFCLHCYMNWPAAQEGYIKNYVKMYGKKVWLTEFCAWEYDNGGQNESAAKQKASMVEKVDFLDAYAGADKYAWFMSSQHTSDIPFNSLFTKTGSDGSLTVVGESYLYLGMETSELLKNAVVRGKALLDSSETGTAPGMYPAEKKEALESALSGAELAFESGTETQMKDALSSLNAAVKSFEESKIPYFTKNTAELSEEDFLSSLTKSLSSGAFTASTGNPSLAFDGKFDTRWESAFEDNQWLQIDLGVKKEFNTILIKWENAYSTEFIIEVSDNGTDWTLAMEEKNGSGSCETFSLTAVQNARYVRFTGKSRNTQYGHSFWEMGIISR